MEKELDQATLLDLVDWKEKFKKAGYQWVHIADGVLYFTSSVKRIRMSYVSEDQLLSVVDRQNYVETINDPHTYLIPKADQLAKRFHLEFKQQKIKEHKDALVARLREHYDDKTITFIMVWIRSKDNVNSFKERTKTAPEKLHLSSYLVDELVTYHKHFHKVNRLAVAKGTYPTVYLFLKDYYAHYGLPKPYKPKVHAGNLGVITMHDELNKLDI